MSLEKTACSFNPIVLPPTAEQENRGSQGLSYPCSGQGCRTNGRGRPSTTRGKLPFPTRPPSSTTDDESGAGPFFHQTGFPFFPPFFGGSGFVGDPGPPPPGPRPSPKSAAGPPFQFIGIAHRRAAEAGAGPLKNLSNRPCAGDLTPLHAGIPAIASATPAFENVVPILHGRCFPFGRIIGKAPASHRRLDGEMSPQLARKPPALPQKNNYRNHNSPRPASSGPV